MISTAYFLFLCVLIFAPVALGATHIWARMAVESVTFLALALVLASSLRSGRTLYRVPALLPCLGFLCWIAVQLIPLPSPVLGLIAPAVKEIYATGYGPENPSFWAPLTIKPLFTLQELLRFSSFVAMYYLTVQLLAERKKLQQALALVMGVAGLLAFQAIVQSFAGNGRIYWLFDPGPDAFFGSFFYRNHFAGFMAMLLPVSLSLFLYYRPRANSDQSLRQRIIHLLDQLKQSPSFRYGLITLLIFSSILLSQSRTGISVAVATTGCMLLFSCKLFRLNRTSPITVGLLAVLTVIVIGTTGLDRMDARFGDLVTENGLSKQGESLSGRLDSWQDSLSIIAAFPLTGSGMGTFTAIYPSYKTISMDNLLRQAHNEYIEMTTDGGLIAVVLIAAFLVLFFRQNFFLFRQRRDNFARHLYLGTLAGLVALLLHSITDYQFRQTSAVPVAFFFLLGIQTVAIHSRQSSSGRSTCLLATAQPKAAATAVAGVCLAGLLVLTIIFHSGEIIGLASFDKPVAGDSTLFNLAPDTDRETLLRWNHQARKAAGYDPLNPLYRTALAYTAQALGEEDQALQAYAAALKLDPVNADTLQLYGEFLSSQGEGESAQQLLQASVQRDRNNRQRQLLYVFWLLGQGYLDKGIPAARAMLDQYPDLAESFLTMLSDSPLPPELIPQTLPDRVAPRIAYASLLEKKGTQADATSAYDLALSYADKDDQVKSGAYNQVLQFYRQQKDDDRTLAVLQQAVSRLPNEFSFRLQLGDQYAKQGMLRRAREEYRFALQLKPEDQQVQKRLETVQTVLSTN